MAGRCCEACLAELPPSAVMCMECGYLLPPQESSSTDEWSLCPRWDCRHPNFGSPRFCERCVYPLPLPPGTEIAGRYRINRLLYADRGLGGYSFGPIYQATDAEQGQTAVVVREFARSDSDLFRLGLSFFRAAYDQLCALQVSPLIPAAFAFIETRTAAYIITEYLPGPSLCELLDDRGGCGFPVGEVVEWGKSLCDLLALMHAQQPPLLKRHLGAEDMLLDSQGTVKVVNLGLARDQLLYWKPLRVLVY
jgi:hypothetical protein